MTPTVATLDRSHADKDAMARRAQLVLALRRAGLRDAKVMAAIERIPREDFVDRAFAHRAHEDIALPIACGQTISQPSVVALMTEALELTGREKVLEVGAGSGYHAAVLSQLARRVYAIERHPPLAREARARLMRLGLDSVTLRTGDGTRGWPEQAPFDRIVLTAAAEDAPGVLLDQLALGGIMVLPVGQSDDVQQLVKIEKTAEGLEHTAICDVLFVPLVEGVAEDES